MLDPVSCTNHRFQMHASGDTVEIVGNIDIPNPNKIMGEFFDAIHEMAIVHGIKSLRIDLRKLKFINSSGIKEMTVWILKQAKLPADKMYSISFICNPDLHWQKITFTSLVWLNHDYVKLEEPAEA